MTTKAAVETMDFLYCLQGHTNYEQNYSMKSDWNELNIAIIYQEIIAFATFFQLFNATESA